MSELTNQKKLDDLHWNLISEEGREFFAERIATATVDRLLDSEINKPEGGTTSLRIELGWMAANFAAANKGGGNK